MKKNGSVTVFFVLLLVLAASVVFAFLETARVSCLKTEAYLCTEQAADAVRASYDQDLWKQYHLLFWNLSGTESEKFTDLYELQSDLIEKNWMPEGSQRNFFLLPVHISSITADRYQLASDDAGQAFREQTEKWVKRTITVDGVEKIWKVVTNAETTRLEENGKKQEQDVDTVLEQYDSQQKQADGAEGESQSSETEFPAKTELPKGQVNPLSWMKQMKKKGILALVMDEMELSDKKADWSDSIEKRNMKIGNWTEQDEAAYGARMFLQLYCQGHFLNVVQGHDGINLNYEMEYLIGGKEADEANLRAVVRRLLLLREGANFAYLETDAQKSQEAMSLALGITSAFANPELAEPVKHAILAAWAYAESISDVRILLDGGRISLIKTDAQWQTSLENLGECLNVSADEAETEGLGYESYLQILLLTVPEEKIAIRSMNLIEKNAGVHMDDMLSKILCTYQYEARPLFWEFVQLGNGKMTSYYLQEQEKIIYE